MKRSKQIDFINFVEAVGANQKLFDYQKKLLKAIYNAMNAHPSEQINDS